MDDKTLRKEILTFLEYQSNIKFNAEPILFSDLKMVGDDSDVFIQRFSSKFQVDFSNFQFEEYFIEEPFPFQYWYWKLFKPEKLNRKTFNITHLIEVVRRGKWFEPKD